MRGVCDACGQPCEGRWMSQGYLMLPNEGPFEYLSDCCEAPVMDPHNPTCPVEPEEEVPHDDR